jgi:hypothetical protein
VAPAGATFPLIPAPLTPAVDAEPQPPFPPLPCFGTHGFRQTQRPLAASRLIGERRLAAAGRHSSALRVEGLRWVESWRAPELKLGKLGVCAARGCFLPGMQKARLFVLQLGHTGALSPTGTSLLSHLLRGSFIATP